MEKKLDDALALLRASAEREGGMEKNIAEMKDLIVAINTAIDEISVDVDTLIAKVEQGIDDPAAEQEVLDGLKALKDKVTGVAAKYPVPEPPAPEPPVPPEV